MQELCYAAGAEELWAHAYAAEFGGECDPAQPPRGSWKVRRTTGGPLFDCALHTIIPRASLDKPSAKLMERCNDGVEDQGA